MRSRRPAVPVLLNPPLLRQIDTALHVQSLGLYAGDKEQCMVELGMFVESIAEELSMDQVGAPSLQRSNTVEHKSLACASAKSEPHEPIETAGENPMPATTPSGRACTTRRVAWRARTACRSTRCTS